MGLIFIFYKVVIWMERMYLTLFGVLGASMIGAALGDRLEAVRESEGERMSALGTVILWVVAGIVILPNLRQSEGRGLAVCLGMLLIIPEVMNRISERWGSCEQLRKGRSLCMAAVLVLHHFPEGIAAGLSCVSQDTGAAVLCWAIVLHSIPETMMLLPAMHDAGFGREGGYLAAAVSGIVTAAGVLTGAML